MMFTRLTIALCALIQAIVVFNAHSYSSQLPHHQDNDYFVRPIQDSDYFVYPIKETVGFVYSGRYHYSKHLDNWKWISFGGYSVRYQGKIIRIYRYCSDQHNGHRKHHRRVSGKHRWTLAQPWRAQSWRIDTPPSFLRPLCSCYRCIVAPRLKKLSLRSGSIHYVIYYSGHAEIHKDEETEHRVKPKPKTEQLEQHSGKRPRTRRNHVYTDRRHPYRRDGDSLRNRSVDLRRCQEGRR